MAKEVSLDDLLKKYEAEAAWDGQKTATSPAILATDPPKSGESLPKLKDIDRGAVLAVLDAIANCDPMSVFDDYGAVKALSDMPIETRVAIRSIKVKEVFEKVGRESVKVGEIKEVQFWDKISASEMLGKFKKMFNDQAPQQVNNILIVDSLKRGLERLHGHVAATPLMPSETVVKARGGAPDHAIDHDYIDVGVDDE